MRPLILMPTINSRHWNACYLQLLSVQRCQHPPQAERSCWGGGSRPPQQQSAAAGGGVGHELSCAGGVASRVRPLQTNPVMQCPVNTSALLLSQNILQRCSHSAA